MARFITVHVDNRERLINLDHVENICPRGGDSGEPIRAEIWTDGRYSVDELYEDVKAIVLAESPLERVLRLLVAKLDHLVLVLRQRLP